MNFQTQVQTLFNSIFSTPLTRSAQQQASKEREVVRSIRQQFEKDELILRRTADGNNVFYLDWVDDFEHKAVRFILKTKTFKIIEIVDQARYDPKEWQCVIIVVNSINGTLESMMQKKRINSEQMSKMQTKKSCTEIPYLYFLPEINKVNIALLSLIANDENSFSLAWFITETNDFFVFWSNNSTRSISRSTHSATVQTCKQFRQMVERWSRFCSAVRVIRHGTWSTRRNHKIRYFENQKSLYNVTSWWCRGSDESLSVH